MSPTELFEEGQLEAAIAAQSKIVLSEPDNISACFLLCEFTAFTGEFVRTADTLDKISPSNDEIAEYIASWTQLLQADCKRHEAPFDPSFLIPPPDHFDEYLEVLRSINELSEDEFLEKLETIHEQFPWLSGFVDGREFDGWRDADDLLNPVLEAIIDDQYCWIPLSQIRKLRIHPIDTYRDRLYRSATVWLEDSSEWHLFLPCLYANSFSHEEETIRVGAGTDWREEHFQMRGVGLKTFLFGEEELVLGEFSQVEIRD